MKKYSFLTALSFLTIAALYAPSLLASTSTKDFIDDASVGGSFEVESSHLALQKSQNEGIKDFAQEMVDDHTQANDKLKTTISTENSGNSLPTNALDSKHQKMLDKLGKKTGADFDKLYIKDQVEAHKDAVKLFNDYAKNGDDAALKSFASETLPTLQKHKQEITQLQQNYKGTD